MIFIAKIPTFEQCFVNDLWIKSVYCEIIPRVPFAHTKRVLNFMPALSASPSPLPKKANNLYIKTPYYFERKVAGKRWSNSSIQEGKGSYRAPIKPSRYYTWELFNICNFSVLTLITFLPHKNCKSTLSCVAWPILSSLLQWYFPQVTSNWFRAN